MFSSPILTEPVYPLIEKSAKPGKADKGVSFLRKCGAALVRKRNTIIDLHLSSELINPNFNLCKPAKIFMN